MFCCPQLNKPRPTLFELAQKVLVAAVVIIIMRTFLGLKNMLKFSLFVLASLVILKLLSPYLPPFLTELFLLLVPVIEGLVEDFLLLWGS
jgi:hypothetical protein